MSTFADLEDELTLADVLGEVRLLKLVPANSPDNAEKGWAHQLYRYDLRNAETGERMWGHWRAGMGVDPKDCTIGRVVDNLLSDATLDFDDFPEMTEATRRRCERQTASLKRVLGQAYDRLVEMDRG